MSRTSPPSRIPYDGGWAWRRNGQIIRTATRDGRVSYFRSGESSPYLVQQGGHVYAYANGQVQRSYDDRGRPVQLDSGQRNTGQRLAQQSAQERKQAKQVAAQQPQRVQPNRPAAAVKPGSPGAPAKPGPETHASSSGAQPQDRRGTAPPKHATGQPDGGKGANAQHTGHGGSDPKARDQQKGEPHDEGQKGRGGKR